MKKIVCELCECTEFTKDGGMFVCNSCATRYSAEEAKALMKEVEGVEVDIIGQPEPRNDQVENLLLLATNAYDAQNNQEAENYCNRALELDTKCYKAWFLKGKAAGWQSSLANPRFDEATHCFQQALKCVPKEEEVDLIEQAIDELNSIGLACLSLRKNSFITYPDAECFNSFISETKNYIYNVSLLWGHKSAMFSLNGYKDGEADIPVGYYDGAARIMNEAAVEAFIKIRDDYDSYSRPGPNDFNDTIQKADLCRKLIENAIGIDEEYLENDTTRYDNLKFIVEYTIDMGAYADYNSYSRDWCLTQDAKFARKKWLADYSLKKAEISTKKLKKVLEEKKQRIDTYWKEHSDEKAKLDAQKEELEAEKTKITDQKNSVEKEINSIKKEKDVSLPSDIELNNLKEQRRELENRRAGLGLFAGKEKKLVKEEIMALDRNIAAVNEKNQREKEEKNKEIEAKVKPLQEKLNKIKKEIESIDKNIKDINDEINKDPLER